MAHLHAITLLEYVCGYGEIGITIYLTHDGRFSLPVCNIILQYTQGVDPKILDFKLACKEDCILIGYGKVTNIDALQVISVAEFGSDKGRVRSPEMTETYILSSRSFCFEET
jgi:hypothetical protein